MVDMVTMVGRNDPSIVKMLPADDRPLPGLHVAEAIEDVLDQFEIVDGDPADVELGQLPPVGNLGESPEEFDAHQVWSVLGVEGDRHVVFLAPVHDVIGAVDGGVVHVEGPLVASWQILLHQDQR